MSIHWFEGLNTLPWNVHIAIVAGEYPPRWGGIGSVVYHLAKHFVDIGHEVSIITRKHSSAIPSQEGVKVIQVPWTPLPMAFTRSYGKNAKRALVKLHEKRPIDVIHAHLPLVSWTRREYRYLQRKIAPIVSSLHGSWLGEREGIRRAASAKESAIWRNPNDTAILLTAKWYARYERAGILESAMCVANSQSTKKEFEQWYRPTPSFSCEVVLWGCDHLFFRPPNTDYEEEQQRHEEIREFYNCGDEDALSYLPTTQTPMLLAVGRLVARKGYMTLLRAMPEIIRQHPSVVLVIVGRGHMKKSLLKEAKKLEIESSIHIQSSLSFQDLAQHFRSADLVIYPSYYEGQGLIPLESLASGTPVITVNQPPLTEMIDQSVGGLFEMGNPDDLARVVCSTLSNVDRGIQAQKGRQRILDNYTYEHNAEAFEAIFKKVISTTQAD